MPHSAMTATVSGIFDALMAQCRRGAPICAGFLCVWMIGLAGPAGAEDSAACDLVGPLEIRDRAVFNPGRYCGDIVLEDARVVFNPGVYVIAGGDLRARGVTRLEGEGVAFVFTGATRAEIGGMDLGETTETRLVPPESGQYQDTLVSHGAPEQVAQSGP